MPDFIIEERLALIRGHIEVIPERMKKIYPRKIIYVYGRHSKKILENRDVHKERALFHLIAQGDEQAYKEFFDEHFLHLVTYASRILHSDLWAEEVVQEVFLKLWKIRSTLTDIENPGAYLNRMMLNRVRDQLKQRHREFRLHHYLHQMTTGSANTTQDRFDYRISEKLFGEAVARLPKQRAVIFKLRHEQGLSYDEIARELDISRYTVRNQLNLALQHVRTYLLENGGISGLLLSFIIFLSIFF